MAGVFDIGPLCHRFFFFDRGARNNGAGARAPGVVQALGGPRARDVGAHFRLKNINNCRLKKTNANR